MRKAGWGGLINCRALYRTPRIQQKNFRAPMIASMTGFARRELAGSWGTLTCELRSVNHRYLEPGFRLPEELRPLESDLRQLLGKNLKRGKIDCTMHLRSAQAAERELRIDATALGAGGRGHRPGDHARCPEPRWMPLKCCAGRAWSRPPRRIPKPC